MMNKSIMKEEELIRIVRDLSKYYNEDTITYLMSLIFLSESVFRKEEFSNYFGSLDWYFEIAKYNICNRTIKIINNLPIIADEFKINSNSYEFSIYYKDKFPVFIFKYNKQNEFNKEKIGPLITIYNITASTKNRIEKIKRQIEDLENIKYNNNYISEYNDNYKPMYEYMFGNYSPKKISIYKPRIDELNKKIEDLRMYGSIQKDICNLITSILLEDWNITFEEDVYLKKLSFIDIYKKKI